jgi:hypothetical protein
MQKRLKVGYFEVNQECRVKEKKHTCGNQSTANYKHLTKTDLLYTNRFIMDSIVVLFVMVNLQTRPNKNLKLNLNFDTGISSILGAIFMPSMTAIWSSGSQTQHVKAVKKIRL